MLDDPIQPGDAARIEALVRTVRSREEPLADRLSVFWGTPFTLGENHPGGRFPPIDRADLREHGRLLWGRDIRAQMRAPARSPSARSFRCDSSTPRCDPRDAEAVARAGLLPLYRIFTREYRPWLFQAGAYAQVSAFANWERRLADA